MKKQVGCHHSWKNYHSFDKSFPKDIKQCSICELVIRSEKVDNLTPFKCHNCGNFVVYAEEVAGLHFDIDIKCKKCGIIAVTPSTIVL